MAKTQQPKIEKTKDALLEFLDNCFEKNICPIQNYNYKNDEEFQKIKINLIDTKKGKIVNNDIIDKIEKNNSILFEFKISRNKTIQRMVFEKGILMPYKFSLKIEKVKYLTYLLVEKQVLSQSNLRKTLTEIEKNVVNAIDLIISDYFEKKTR